MKGYMSVSEAAAELCIGRSRVHQLIRAGILEAERIGNAWAVTVESVERRKVENPGPGKPRESRCSAFGLSGGREARPIG